MHFVRGVLTYWENMKTQTSSLDRGILLHMKVYSVRKYFQIILDFES